MKPFNLEAALAGAPVVTRNGEKVEQIFHATALNRDANLLVILNGRDYFYLENGRYSDHEEIQLDLFMAATKMTLYQNIYKNHAGYYYGSTLFTMEEDAELSISDGCIATVKIEIED